MPSIEMNKCACACVCMHACAFVRAGCKFVVIDIYKKGLALDVDLAIPDDAWIEELKTQLQSFKVPDTLEQTHSSPYVQAMI